MLPRVAAASHAHGLMDIRAPRQRIANRPAQAGRRPAKGLDLCGVVVRLILEHEEPGLLAAVGELRRYVNRTGIDLFGYLEVGQLAPPSQELPANRREVHQGVGPLIRRLAVDLLARRLPQGQTVAQLISLAPLFDIDTAQAGHEGRVPAVVGPIRIQNPKFRQRGVAPLAREVRAAHGQVFGRHGQAKVRRHLFKGSPLKGAEARQDRHRRRRPGLQLQALREGQGRLARIDRVYQLRKEGFAGVGPRRRCQGKGIDPRTAHHRPRPEEEGHTLRRAVRPLVILPRQVLRRKDNLLLAARQTRHQGPGVPIVALNLGKDPRTGRPELILVEARHIIAVEDANPLKAGKLRGIRRGKVANLVAQGAAFDIKTRTLFCVYTTHDFPCGTGLARRHDGSKEGGGGGIRRAE